MPSGAWEANNVAKFVAVGNVSGLATAKTTTTAAQTMTTPKRPTRLPALPKRLVLAEVMIDTLPSLFTAVPGSGSVARRGPLRRCGGEVGAAPGAAVGLGRDPVDRHVLAAEGRGPGAVGAHQHPVD